MEDKSNLPLSARVAHRGVAGLERGTVLLSVHL